MNYTKGEWCKEGNKIKVTGSGTVAICPSPTDSEGVLEFVVNARLIAQSPRMYELLKYLAEQGWNAGVTEEAREIIAEVEKK